VAEASQGEAKERDKKLRYLRDSAAKERTDATEQFAAVAGDDGNAAEIGA
jgi:hypothetical protein